MTTTKDATKYPTNSGADFSTCRQYRYRLWRRWDATRAMMVLVLLNPSTADAEKNDPTVARAMARAQQLGYGGIVVVNLFAYCATDPRTMKAHAAPIGRDNDDAILEAAAGAGMILCGWGNHGRHLNRAGEVIGLLLRAGHRLHHLGMTQDGQPQHPLYVGYDVKPQELI